MTRTCQILSSAALMCMIYVPTFAQVSMVFQENFDELPLQAPVDEDSPIRQAFTHEPPTPEWRIDNSDVPGVNEPSIGIFEWEGWSFANKDFWIQVSNDERRSEFTRSFGTVAVADPDEWNDRADPANNFGFYNTFLETPFFDIDSLREKGSRLQFQFDSSWRPQCCDDGEQFDPDRNNKTAVIKAIFEDGSEKELLNWQSAPFIDAAGNPFRFPGPNNFPNPNFKPTATNELMFVDLSEILLNPDNHLGFQLQFGLINAGDDWWWAMDNMQMISTGFEIDGDMDLNGVVEEADTSHFAQAMHNELDYILTHYGESPAVRGSPDSTFDFDDIEWFVGVLNDEGVAATQAAVAAAISAYGVPEPSSGCLAICFAFAGLLRNRTRC